MPEKIVYFLGAGFSAPLGLPVMSDFLIRSKDLFSSDPDRFRDFHFEEVFKTITKMHPAKSHYNVDLFNIEEILSLLEMKYYADPDNPGDRELFTDYLKAVIEALTPPLPPPTTIPHPDPEWPKYLFGGPLEHPWREYCFFVASLFNLVIQISPTSTGRLHITLGRQSEPPVQYSVVSLNYDLVLEKCLDLILDQCSVRQDFRFAKNLEEAEAPQRVPLAKLHGSVDSVIVPPTWNKVAQPKEIQEAWQLAYKVLSEATQIRILGYSLPQTDAYVRYLLESATMEEPHRKNLKHIDVGCLDPDDSVKERYEKFLCFYRRRFEKFKVEKYLQANHAEAMAYVYRLGNEGDIIRQFRQLAAINDRDRDFVDIIQSDKLERIHERAFREKIFSEEPP